MTTKPCFGIVLACSSPPFLWEIMPEALDQGWQTMVGSQTCSLPPLLLVYRDTATPLTYLLTMAGFMLEQQRRVVVGETAGIWLLQNKFVDYYPKDWRRRQSSYLQSLEPHGVDRLINDQLGYEKNKTTTKRPNRKFLQNYCSAWERLTCEPDFDITGFL